MKFGFKYLVIIIYAIKVHFSVHKHNYCRINFLIVCVSFNAVSVETIFIIGQPKRIIKNIIQDMTYEWDKSIRQF